MDRDEWRFPWGRGWPEIDRAGMAEVDRRMIGTYGIALEKMMENAGRALALVAWRRWLHGVEAPRVTVLAGSGGNGGGALVAARRLATWGASVDVVLTREARALAPVPAAQLAILAAMGVSVSGSPGEGANLILEGWLAIRSPGRPWVASPISSHGRRGPERRSWRWMCHPGSTPRRGSLPRRRFPPRRP